MNSRTIVTSQPDVACDVCERRLLRGEQPETFLAAGQPRTVCELCAPRASHQGWKRISDLEAAGLALVRPRRARNIFDRLRAAGRSNDAPSGSDRAERIGLDDDVDPLGAEAELGLPAPRSGKPADDGPLARALQVFNAGEYPRRIGGVARSLGEPQVNVRELEVTGIVSIVVAWELCWYKYRVDLDDAAGDAELVTQGTELAELEREEREGNALADERGALHLRADQGSP
jgi:hypothetical protein